MARRKNSTCWLVWVVIMKLLFSVCSNFISHIITHPRLQMMMTLPNQRRGVVVTTTSICSVHDGSKGTPPARAPPTNQNFLNLMQFFFWKKSVKSYVGAPPRKVGAPSYEECWICPWSVVPLYSFQTSFLTGLFMNLPCLQFLAVPLVYLV